MADAGLLSVKITADDKELIAALSRAREAVKSTAANVASAVTKFAALGTAATAAGAAILAGMVRNSLEAVDAQAKLARQLGGTTAAVQGLERAGELAGIGADTLAAAASGLNAKLGQAMRGAGTAGDALKTLGLDAQQLAQLDVDERMAAIGDAIASSGMNAQQAADTLRQLGIRQREMISLFEGGGDAIRSARQEVEGFGVAVSEIEAAQIEAAGDAMTSIGLTMKGISNQITVALAPLLQEVGERFHDAAKESGGFRDVVIPSLESVAMGVGYVGNVIRGLGVAWQSVRVVAAAVNSVLVDLAVGVVKTITDAIDLALRGINTAIDGVNKIPGVDIGKIPLLGESEFMANVTAFGEAFNAQVGAEIEALHELAMEPLPTQQIEAFFDAVKKRSAEAAEEIVKARGAMSLPGEGIEIPGKPEKEDEDLEVKYGAGQHDAFIAQMAARIEAIRGQNASELELALEKYNGEQELLEQGLLNRVLTEQEYNDLSLQQQRAHEAGMADMKLRSWKDIEQLSKLSWKNQVSVVAGSLAEMTSALSTKSRTMFEINKGAALSSAAVKGGLAIMDAWEAGMSSGGPWAPVVAAGYAAAATVIAASNISAIASTSYGGGGGRGGAANVPSMSTSSVGQAGAPAGPAQPSQTLAVSGISDDALFSGQMVRALADKLLDFQRDGGKVVFQA